MFQKMQQLVRMNEAMAPRSSRIDVGESRSTRSSDGEVEALERPDVEAGEDREQVQAQVQRLQAIVVQQAKEIETLRRRQRDTMADGRVWPAATSCVDNQVEGRDSISVGDGDTTGNDCDDGSVEAQTDYRSAAKKHVNQLRKLPLTSLRAELKRKDLQLLHFQQLVAKLETRLGQIIDRKRSMAQSYQQTARTQQAHLKKYLAYIRQQTAEKKDLERQVRELKQYADVLEKKVVSTSAKLIN
ncbi:hypothetical protein ON010_g17321 [Phytophthora cinnamomi]|nr:hypothetical protein ON010_g17321 [Phytophthora cinnamomi]